MLTSNDILKKGGFKEIPTLDMMGGLSQEGPRGVSNLPFKVIAHQFSNFKFKDLVICILRYNTVIYSIKVKGCRFCQFLSQKRVPYQGLFLESRSLFGKNKKYYEGITI